jgi:hypothetical protein
VSQSNTIQEFTEHIADAQPRCETATCAAPPAEGMTPAVTIDRGVVAPVIDKFERALGTQTSDEAYAEGVRMTYRHLMTTLASIGLEPLRAAGEAFDPQFMNQSGALKPTRFLKRLFSKCSERDTA